MPYFQYTVTRHKYEVRRSTFDLQQYKQVLSDFRYPLRPTVGKFHRWATFLLITLAGLLVALWLVMRVMYPQSLPHTDILTDYETLISGDLSTIEDNVRLLAESLPASPNPEPKIYVNKANDPMLVVRVDMYRERCVARIAINTVRLPLIDVLQRWGRPDYKARDDITHYWHLTWLRASDTIAATCRSMKPEAAVTLLTITRQ